MEVQETTLENGISFLVRGSLSATGNSALKFFEQVSAAVSKRPQEIEIDMSKVVFIDSLSIGMLVGVLIKCQEQGIAFRLTNLPPHLVSIFDATNLKKAFPLLY